MPKSSKNLLSLMEDGTIKLKIKAAPVDGKANKACEEFIADYLSVSKSQVKVVAGFQSKTKLVEVLGDAEKLTFLISELLVK